MEAREFGDILNQEIKDNFTGEENFHISKCNVEIDVLGQSSLLMNSEINCRINLTETRDFDAHTRCHSLIRELIKRILKERFALVLDNLSDEIWMPADTVYQTVYDEGYVIIRLAKPVYVLTSKAIKAKEKNKQLIKESLAIYGNELEDLIRNNGGDPEYFK